MAQDLGRNGRYKLVIGNKNWSSWSLRPWLAMRRGGIAFDEINVSLRRPDTKARILEHSRSGKIPALKIGDVVIWDSLAILEYLAEAHPDAHLWPEDRSARAAARSAAAEMHSGFQALRESMPMEFIARIPARDVAEPVVQDIRRVVELWRDVRDRFGAGGPFLFGAFSNADAMYAPVASRFRTHVEDLSAYGDDGTVAAYVKTIFGMPEIAEWEEGARAELAHTAAS